MVIDNTKKRRAYIKATKDLGYELIHPQSRLFALVSDEMIDELTGRQLAIVMDQISKIKDLKNGKFIWDELSEKQQEFRLRD